MGRPADSNAADESLTVRDNRTGETYNIPYVAIGVFFDDAGVVCKVESEALRTGVYRIKDNTVTASAFKAIAAPLKPGERVENETPKGLRVSDKGFLNTAVIQSQITYIDGEAGILRYRGYPIEQLALHSTHLETAYLLIYGTLPGEKQLRMFENEVMSHTFVHADAENFFRSFRCALARSLAPLRKLCVFGGGMLIRGGLSRSPSFLDMTRTRWPSSRAHSRTSGRITARPTPPCKVRVPSTMPLGDGRE